MTKAHIKYELVRGLRLRWHVLLQYQAMLQPSHVMNFLPLAFCDSPHGSHTRSAPGFSCRGSYSPFCRKRKWRVESDVATSERTKPLRSKEKAYNEHVKFLPFLACPWSAVFSCVTTRGRCFPPASPCPSSSLDDVWLALWAPRHYLCTTRAPCKQRIKI